MSRKVILYIATSLDGFIADEAGGIEWLSTATDYEESDNSYEEFYRQVDTVLMGRTTYDQVVNELAVDNYPYADSDSYILTSRGTANKEKVVFTDEAVESLVQRLKAEAGQDIWIVGGSSLVTPLVANNMIDEYHLATLPIILGKGIPLFAEQSQPLKLKLKEVSSLNGIVSAIYTKTTN